MDRYYKQFENCIQWEKPYCTDVCPFHLEVLEFQEKLSAKRFNAAYTIFRNATGFPQIAAALCPEYCARVCPRGGAGFGAGMGSDTDAGSGTVASASTGSDTGAGPYRAVQLNLLERSCIALAKRKEPTAYNLPSKGKKVAIVGAGPSGMACALRLATKKYEVHIFERADRIGGQLWELLPSELFLEDFELQMKHESYELHLNTEITEYQCGGGSDERKVSLQSLPKGNRCETASPVQCAVSTHEENFVGSFDAVYVATGSGTIGPGEDAPFFRGGSLTGKDALHALADGLETAQTIDIYLQTGNPDHDATPRPSKVEIDSDKLAENIPPVHATAVTSCAPPGAAPAGAALTSGAPAGDAPPAPAIAALFTEDEAVAEAGRCIRCGCDACMTYCDLCGYTGKWPLEMRDEIMTTVMSSVSIVHKTPARRLINTCTQCMLCDEVCPGHIQLGEMIAESRRLLHKQDKMPPAYHGFWLNDMRFANGEYAAISRKPPGQDEPHPGQDNPAPGKDNPAPGQSQSDYAFFPGCHLGASNPLYVELPYKWLLKQRPDTGLFLRCCGVPADWAGNEEMHAIETAALKSEWENLGRPTLITACPTCKKHLKEYIPGVNLISLYEVLNEWGGNSELRPEVSGTYSVFDPCSARNDASVQSAVRDLAAKAGVQTAEFPKTDKHGCCGFGGNVTPADPAFAEFVAKERSELSPHPYITYCINCRDVFKNAGKPAVHILDLMFENTGGIDAGAPKSGPLPSLTQRRQNRMTLKENLLREIWSEEAMVKPKEPKYRLHITPEIQSKMDKQQLIEDDIIKVLEETDRLNRRTYAAESDTYICYAELGYITCWVEYRVNAPAANADATAGTAAADTDANAAPAAEYDIVNIFSHRMKIELENMWNGRKTDADL
jgi:Fe-S oxidoreductase